LIRHQIDGSALLLRPMELSKVVNNESVSLGEEEVVVSLSGLMIRIEKTNYS
jgi:hypothetical protein